MRRARSLAALLVLACGKHEVAPTPSTIAVVASTPPSSTTASSVAGPPSWSRDVAPHLERACAAAKGCHGDAPTDSLELDLRPGVAYAQLVSRPSSVRPSALLVAPGKPDRSFLVDKLSGRLGSKEGKVMPLDVETGAPKSPTPHDEAFVRDVLVPWIAAGARND
jgi:hypothetical protein